MSTPPRPWFRFSLGGRAPAPPPTRPSPPPPHPSIPTRPTPTQQPAPPPPSPSKAQFTSPQPSTKLAPNTIPTRPFVPPRAKSPQPSPVRKHVLSSNKSPSHQVQTKPVTSSEPAAIVKVPTPPPSPKVIKPFERAPPESPKLKPSDKTAIDKGTIKKLSHSEDKLGSSVVTLAGENKGALMEVRPWPQNGKQAMSVSGEEGKSRDKDKSKGGMMVKSPMAGYFNSNMQGLNNSIVCNGSIIYNDPGIHISVTRKLNGD